jgi:hypothetical protein
MNLESKSNAWYRVRRSGDTAQRGFAFEAPAVGCALIAESHRAPREPLVMPLRRLMPADRKVDRRCDADIQV